jgi:hypothetical protein
MFRLFIVAAAVAGVYFVGAMWSPMHTVLYTVGGLGITWLLLASVATGYGAHRITK